MGFAFVETALAFLRRGIHLEEADSSTNVHMSYRSGGGPHVLNIKGAGETGIDGEIRRYVADYKPWWIGGYHSVSSQPQTFAHVLGLFPHRPPLQIAEYGNSKSGQSRDDGTSNNPPFGRRFIIALCGGVLLIPGCYCGSRLIDARKILLRRAVIGTAFCVFG